MLEVAPPIFFKSSKGQDRFVKYYARLVAASAPKSVGKNWELNEGDEVKAKEGDPMPKGAVAQWWTESGVLGGKTMRSAAKYILKGVNIGRANERDPWAQVISKARSAHAKQYKKVNHPYPPLQALHSLPIQRDPKKFDIGGSRYWAPDDGKRWYVSLKLDGNRLGATLDNAGAVVLYGRSGDSPPNTFPHIQDALLPILSEHPGVVLDGEIYTKDMEHQEIQSIYSNAAKEDNRLGFHIFDAILPNRDATFEERLAFLKTLPLRKPLYLVKAIPVTGMAMLEKVYRRAMATGNEGLVLRDGGAKYLTDGASERRSPGVLKIKPMYSDEFEIVGIKEGTGDDAGTIVWILKTSTGSEFSARVAGTRDSRRAMYKKVKDEGVENYVGRMMTVAYGDMTKDKIPKFPVAQRLRGSE